MIDQSVINFINNQSKQIYELETQIQEVERNLSHALQEIENIKLEIRNNNND